MEQTRRSPTEPPTTGWQFPEVDDVDPDGLVAVGADLEPGTLLEAYRGGFFPMPVGEPQRMGWWSPDPRGVIEPADLHISRSLTRSMRRFEVTIDRCFTDVMAACGDPNRPHGWINAPMLEAYTELHRLGWAHSVEIWADGELAGGLYGVSIGAFFAGESMFHRVTDASKAAVVAVVRQLEQAPGALFDVQWTTPHLRSLGASDMPRTDYLERLRHAVATPGPAWDLP